MASAPRAQTATDALTLRRTLTCELRYQAAKRPALSDRSCKPTGFTLLVSRLVSRLVGRAAGRALRQLMPGSAQVSAVVRDAMFALLMWLALYPAVLQPAQPAQRSAGGPGQLAQRSAGGPAGGQTQAVQPGAPLVAARADFGGSAPSDDARSVADWVARERDSQGMAFVIVDKKAAQLYVFNAHAQLLARSAVLLGSALGDETVPGIGKRPIELVKPEERTTPAGRYVGERGRNARGEDVVWVDYDAAVSMHRVVTHNSTERRLERLSTPTPSDNRISYGCINVPVAFYESHIRPAFAERQAVIYLLPDSGSLRLFFPRATATD